MIAQPEGKACSRCHEFKPITDFRRRWKDRPLRHSECRACHSRLNSDLARRKRQKVLGGYVGQLAAAEGSKAIRLCEAMVTRLGGVKSVAKLWAEQIKTGAALRPGSRQVLSSLQAVMRLIEAADRASPPPPPVDMLSDEDLEREFHELVGKALGCGIGADY